MKKLTTKSFFDRGLYTEGIKQLKIIGVLVTVLIGVIAIAIPIESVSSYPDSPKVVHALNMNPLMLLCFFAAAPLMTLNLFSFLNKRNASDFYHSLPHKRECIFISYMASILTWIAIIIVSTMSVSIIFTSLFPNDFAIHFYTVLTYMLNVFAASLTVSAAIAIAMSVSGNSSTNIIVSGLILFMPRVAMMLISDTVTNSNPIISDKHFLPLFKNGYNVITSTMTFDIETVMSLKGFIYTFTVGLIYAVIACILFKRRRSESAGQSAPNKTMQAVFRITLTMAYCLIVCWAITAGMNTDAVIILYIIGILIYFGYELVTTRKWKNLARIFPGLGIVAALNIALALFMSNAGSMILSNIPDAEDIEEVAIVNDELRYGNSSLYEYYRLILGQKMVGDEESVKDIADSLEQTVTVWKNSESQYSYKEYFSKIGYNEVTVKIKPKLGGVMYRNIYVSNDVMRSVNEKMSDLRGNRDVLTDLPQYMSGTLSIDGVIGQLTAAQFEAIFRSYNEEIKKIDFDLWLSHMTEKNSTSPTVATMNFITTVGSRSYRINLPINYNVTPDTARLFYRYLNEKTQENMAEFDDIMQFLSSKLTEGSIDLGETVDASIYMQIEDEGNTYIKQFYANGQKDRIYDISEKELVFCIDLAEKGSEVSATYDRNIRISVSYCKQSEYTVISNKNIDLIVGIPEDIDLSEFEKISYTDKTDESIRLEQ